MTGDEAMPGVWVRPMLTIHNFEDWPEGPIVSVKGDMVTLQDAGTGNLHALPLHELVRCVNDLKGVRSHRDGKPPRPYGADGKPVAAHRLMRRGA